VRCFKSAETSHDISNNVFVSYSYPMYPLRIASRSKVYKKQSVALRQMYSKGIATKQAKC
jgi:hypothetical protein